MEFSFERGAIELEDIERLTAQIWADLAFDDAAKAALRRDGLVLAGLRLTGPNPFVLRSDGEKMVVVSADAEALIDLWRVYFLRQLRERAANGAPRRDVS